MCVCDIIAIFVLACSILQRKGNIDLLQIHNSLRILCIYNPIVMEIDNHMKFPFYLPQPLCKASIQAETRLREGVKKSKWKFIMAFAIMGGGLEGVSFAIKLF